jgi:hypothetical protein
MRSIGNPKDGGRTMMLWCIGAVASVAALQFMSEIERQRM